ncbi:MAG TPA: T9SS type A sorting domain-containing protein, partial [candidate division Zixibacteria bacterium]|nr:T9SS type A sorting domain-containing protein [candidate division Zixibacteria bacterium]
MKKILFFALILIAAVSFARTPEEKSGTIAIMKTLRGEAGGMAPEILAQKRITRPSLPYHYDTPEGNFKIHYTLSGDDAIDSVGYAHKIGEYMEHCWSVFADSMGYLPPPSDGTLGGDSRYDVYLKNISAYGLTYPGTSGSYPWNNLISYIEIENDFDGVYPNDDPDGPVAGAMRVTVAHELHHAFQFGLYGSCAAWISEMSSVAMEERLYPQVNDYVWLIDYMLDAPQMPLNYGMGYHMYGMGLYAQYWNMVYGDGFLATVWDTMRILPDESAVFATCELYSIELAEDLANFAAQALFVGSRNNGFFPDGAALSDMSVGRTHTFYPAEGTASPQPYGYGMSFILFENTGSVPRDMLITFDGADGVDWAVRAIWKNGDSTAVYPITIGDFGVGEIRVPFADEAEMIGLAVVPAGGWTSRYNYSYSASLVACSIDESRIPSALAVKTFPNPFNSGVKITIDDSWIGESVEIYDVSGRLIDKIS